MTGKKGPKVKEGSPEKAVPTFRIPARARAVPVAAGPSEQPQVTISFFLVWQHILSNNWDC
jgi:hypothetical protein